MFSRRDGEKVKAFGERDVEKTNVFARPPRSGEEEDRGRKPFKDTASLASVVALTPGPSSERSRTTAWPNSSYMSTNYRFFRR